MNEKPKKKPLNVSPIHPVDFVTADVVAIQALMKGDADSNQQKRALDWIINIAAGTYDLSYRPGVEGERDTAFSEGKRFVGLSIVKMTRLNAMKLRSEENV